MLHARDLVDVRVVKDANVCGVDGIGILTLSNWAFSNIIMRLRSVSRVLTVEHLRSSQVFPAILWLWLGQHPLAPQQF